MFVIYKILTSGDVNTFKDVLSEGKARDVAICRVGLLETISISNRHGREIITDCMLSDVLLINFLLI
jgi:hypothetical protein